jgi:hypothetical protein
MILQNPTGLEGKLQLASYRMSTWPVLAAFIVILLLGVGMSQMSVGQAVLKSAGLVGSSNTYTSLAFLNPQSQPTRISSSGTNVNVAFVIRNATTTAHDYQWSLVLLQDGHNHRLAVREIRVQPGLEASVNNKIKISCRKGKIRLTVSLARPAEHIDAWMICKA